MTKVKIQHERPPYGNAAPRLLKSIFHALHLLCRLENDSKALPHEEVDKQIYDCFKWLNDKGFYPRNSGKNSHITEGFPKNVSDLPKDPGAVRIVQLIKQAWKSAIDQSGAANKSEEDKKVFLPSPLRILYDILTVPEFPQSRAYALVTCRNILFEYFRVYPEAAKTPADDLTTGKERFVLEWETFSMEELTKAYSEIETYLGHRDNYPKPMMNTAYSRTKLFLAHYLAMKGIAYLRFGLAEKKRPVKSIMEARELREKYCEEGKLIGAETLFYEFRRSQDYRALPELSHIINQIWGIPLPIQNADTVFNGAMKFSTSGSLVISVHGKAGTGKTSFALAAAASLAPLGTSTYYISFEEEPEDLRVRLHSLIPLYLRKLSFFNEDSNRWFFTSKPEILASGASEASVGCNLMNKFTEEHLNAIKRTINAAENEAENKGIPNLCPLLIIVDGVSVLCSNQEKTGGYKALHDFVRACKSLNVMVMLLSGEDNEAIAPMDYMVDTVIKLNYEGTDKVGEKPMRLFQLVKTRQQVSRPGSHIFHMSGGKGFRIDPQLPSQLDKQQIMVRHLPDYSQIIAVLTGTFHAKQGELFRRDRLVDLYAGSQILLHGHGSGGKAGLALRILATPPEQKAVGRDDEIASLVKHKRRKILIISFLYAEAYYKNLLSKMGQKEQRAQLDIMSFYPGFLTPENFLSKIIRRLNTGVLQGEPFTGVLLDGLHNVFLQFPALKDNTMVWPMLYNLLGRSRVTTVTTFTTFSFAFTHGVEESSARDYDEMLIEGHKPFLHALVQATDFYLILERERAGEERSKGEINYELTVREVINQPVPKEPLIWDREKLEFK